MEKPPRDKPRRVESNARMTVAEEVPVAREAVMVVADEIPPLLSVQSDPEILDSRPWYPIEVAPQDGTLLEALTNDGSEFMMVWRRTSRFNAEESRWVPTGFWSSHLSREPIKVEPVSWRMPEGFCMPGSIAP